jgi:hypothetical protein
LTIVCNGCVYLYWFAGVPTWTARYTALWPLLHRIPYQPSPKFEVLIGVLKQMGIDPAVEFIALSRNSRNGGCSSTARCLTASQAGGTDSKHKDFVPFGDKASGNRFPLVQGTPRHIEKAITGTAVKKVVMFLLGPFV